MSQADYGRAGRALRDEYDFLRARVDAIVSGEQALDGTLASRAVLYAEAARSVSYEATLSREMATRGFTEERNILDREAAHCVGPGSCPEQTARGWVPAGALIPLGERLCKRSDKCRILRRNPLTGEIAA